MTYPRPINDARLTPDLKRTRSGSTQMFQHPDERGLQPEHYHIHLEPPEKHIYAELIDGVWHWVNGCAECNGEPRNWTTYIECDEHNRCQDCGCSRDSLDEPPWGHPDGWICKPCMTIREAERKAEMLNTCEPIESWIDLYSNDHIRCPHCGYKHEASYDEFGSDIFREEPCEHTCSCCDKTFAIEPIINFTYTTAKTLEEL